MKINLPWWKVYSLKHTLFVFVAWWSALTGCRANQDTRVGKEGSSEILSPAGFTESYLQKMRPCCAKINLIDFGICFGDTSRYTQTADPAWNKSAADSAHNICRNLGLQDGFLGHHRYANPQRQTPNPCIWQKPSKWPNPSS